MIITLMKYSVLISICQRPENSKYEIDILIEKFDEEEKKKQEL